MSDLTVSGLDALALDEAAREMQKAVALGAGYRDGAGVAVLTYLKAAPRQSLTSPETIEKAAKAGFESMRIRHSTHSWEGTTEHNRGMYRKIAEAVLRSVEEGTQ